MQTYIYVTATNNINIVISYKRIIINNPPYVLRLDKKIAINYWEIRLNVIHTIVAILLIGK